LSGDGGAYTAFPRVATYFKQLPPFSTFHERKIFLTKDGVDDVGNISRPYDLVAYVSDTN
jgi:hypothetical protein